MNTLVNFQSAQTPSSGQFSIGSNSKTYFGVDFETMSRKLDRDIEDSENRERLWSFSFHIDELEKRLLSVRREQRGADWVHAGVQSLITRSRKCPDAIVDRVASMVRTRSNELTIDRLMTEREIEELEAAMEGASGTRSERKLPRPQYKQERLALIDGFPALYPENNLREFLVLGLQKSFEEFRDINSLISSELRRWVRWANSVEPVLEQVTRSSRKVGDFLPQKICSH